MKPTNRTAALSAGLFFALCSGSAFAQDWPQWRGENRDGRTTFTAPQAWPKELDRKWKATVGYGDATPALVGDKVYVFARQGNDETLQCLSAEDGKPIWQDKYATNVTVGGPAAGHKGPRSSPSVSDGKVVTLDEGATISCLDAASGKLIWRKDFSKDLGGSAWPGFNTSSSPVVFDRMVVAHLGGRGKGTIMALDLGTGDTKWKYEGEGPAYASPAVMTVDGTKMIVEETEKSIVGISAADGKLLWQVAYGGGGGGGRGGMRGGPGGGGPPGGDRGPGGSRGGDRGPRPDGDRGPGGDGPRPEGAAPGGRPDAPQADVAPGGDRPPGGPGGDRGRGGPPGGDRGRGGRPGGMGSMTMSYNAASPVIDGSTIIVSAPGAGTKAFAIEKKDDAFAAKELWSNTETTVQFNTPVIKDGRLYGLSANGNLFCMDSKTGKTLWTGKNKLGERGFGTMVDAGPFLVALTPASELIVFKPDDKTYSEVARIKVSDAQTYAYPVLAGNRVIVKDQDAVIFYTVK